MKLLTIPTDKYDQYKLDVAFNGYKWDTQFLDSNTVARHALVLTKKEAEEVMRLTEGLAGETLAAENFLKDNRKLTKKLRLPKKIARQLFENVSSYNSDRHIRLMRFDFHKIAGDGWAISEVNSDVPGGFSEASIMPRLVKKYLPFSESYGLIDFGEALVGELTKKIGSGGVVGLVHCTSYSDDRQVMQFLGDRLSNLGYHSVYLACDHVRFTSRKAYSILNGQELPLDAIVRFTPLEWLVRLPSFHNGYFSTSTTSCNHPIAILAQTKCFPLVWDELEDHGIMLPYWRRLLPHTVEVKKAKGKQDYIYKPVYGRVGEDISIKSAISDEEYKKILRDVRRHKNRYIAQKMFQSMPITSTEGEHFHICLGAYSLGESFAGFYARCSKTARIDSAAADIPVLIENIDE